MALKTKELDFHRTIRIMSTIWAPLFETYPLLLLISAISNFHPKHINFYSLGCVAVGLRPFPFYRHGTDFFSTLGCMG